MADDERQIPTRVRLTGRALNGAVARAPWLWPVLRPAMRGFFDRAARGWDERTNAGSVDHLAALASAVTKVSPAPERALDLGTGSGEAALFLAREFPHASVRGVDVSEEMVRVAKAKVGLDTRVAFKVGDAASLPYPDDHFDLVAQVNAPPFFSEISRVLSPGGHVIVVASLGAATPFFTPPAVLERGFRRRGIERIAAAEAGNGTYFVGRAHPE